MRRTIATEVVNPVATTNSCRQAKNAQGNHAQFSVARIATPLIALFVLLALTATPAFAEEGHPWWHVNVGSRPSVLTAGPERTVVVSATNLGDGNVDGEAGSPVILTDTLPEGISAEKAFYIAGLNGLDGGEPCKVKTSRTIECIFAGSLTPYSRLEVDIYVSVEAGLHGTLPGEAKATLPNVVTVSGGGAPSASAHEPLTVGSTPTEFGVESFESVPENAGGSVDTQAGAHPFQLTTTVVLNAGTETYGIKVHAFNETFGLVEQPAMPREIQINTPPGLVGNPSPFPQCTEGQFKTNKCSLGSQVGVAAVTLAKPVFSTESVPVFNMVPGQGEPARFGFKATGVPVFLDASVRTGKDYGVTITSSNIVQTAALLSSQVTFWGWPADPRHNDSRGYGCVGAGIFEIGCDSPEDTVSAPFLSLPTTCTTNPAKEPLQTAVEASSWPAPGRGDPLEPVQDWQSSVQQPLSYDLQDQSGSPIALDGCNKLSFEPSIKVTPDSSEASKPSGLNVDVHVNQNEVLIPNGLAESDVKGITVALPEGIAVDPSGGDGLEGCSEGLAGVTGVKEFNPVSEPGSETATFSPQAPELLRPGVSFCANASKIGEVTIKSPLLPKGQYVKGFVYLAAQEQNPFGSLVAIYIIAEDPISGTVVKQTGEVHITATGQLITTIHNVPQLAFEDAELHFFGGERAPLASPAHCGAYESTGTFTPWSGNEPVNRSSSFNITSGPNGSPCPGASLPFSPSLHASVSNIQAGGFTPFSMTMSRESGQQNLQAISLKMPPGLSGLLSGVELCPEPQADQGTCGPRSLIGETTVSVGVGGDPFSVKGGKVYITGPYEGAPFGLSIVNPAKAGPFDLAHTKTNDPACDCVLVRAKIEVNPITAALSVTSDDSGPYKIPTSLEGIPLQIQHVNVTINRPGFTFNPTSCDPMHITGSIASDEGSSSPAEVPFQVTNCAILKFAPKFAVSTSGKTSKANGASLSVKLTYPSAPFGTQANIARVKVDLPKQLPSRLTTLQKACTAAQFEANPGGCPSASIIGHAKAITPLIPVPLEGPAYFVSHGGEAFPSLIMVLQGYGVKIDLVGTTFISKAGITSSTFKTVPDAPVGSFELTLPEGKFSALTANGNLCKSKLAMPTEFLAQNGAKINESTKVAVTGCPKAKKAKKKVKKGHGGRKGKGGKSKK